MAESAKPSAQSLAALEQAFSQDPTSEAYRPLSEAYLALGRFMEAMVVAKKGAKARPTEAIPHVLLARIYAEQNKDPKAFEELQTALTLQPQDLDALKLQAQLFFKAGQKGPGEEALLKALAAAPADPEVAQLMARFGVQPPAPPPPPVQLVSRPPSDRPPSLPPGRVAIPLGAEGRPAPRPVARAATVTMAAQVAHDLARLAEEEEFKARQKKGPGLMLTLGLVVVLLLVLGMLFAFSKYRNKRDHAISADLKKTQESLAHDSYAAYQDAEKSAQHALELDPTNFAADAYLAYINALRFGENGEGEEFRQRAQEYLAAAQAQKQPHAYIFAADAYLKFFSHHPDQAEQTLNEVLNQKDSAGSRMYQSNLLSGALGIIQLQEGKLNEARRNLVDAHNLAPADVRVTAALGTVDARLASVATAETFFQAALKVDADHVPSLLGLAQLELEAVPPDLPAADRALSHLAALGPGALSPRQSAFAKFIHAQLLYAQNKPQAADEERGAFALDPKNAEMMLVAGRRLRRAGQPEKAIAMIRQALELDPNRGAFYAELGEAYLAIPNGGASNAIQQLTQALARVPSNARLLTALAEAYRRQGDLEHAQQQWQAALKIEPDNSEAHLGLARYYLQKGDVARARSEYDLVARHAQGAMLAEAQTELGRAALERGDGAKARDLLTSALTNSQSYAPTYFYLGKLLSADRGKRPQARKLFQDYLERSPDGPLAAEARRLSR